MQGEVLDSSRAAHTDRVIAMGARGTAIVNGNPPPAGIDLKRFAARQRAEARLLHDQGASGTEVCTTLTVLCDQVIDAAYRSALENAPAQSRSLIHHNLALVAIGGYARFDQAPFSDVDVLFLVSAHAPAEVREFISKLVPNLWDFGIKLSHAVRSPQDCITFARRDVPGRTALIETRLLAGSYPLFMELQRLMHRFLASLPIPSFVSEALALREPEHRDYFADTVYLLEPNVKKSPGGLRDLHLFRWVAMITQGSTDFDMLRLTGVINHQDARTLLAAGQFLRRLRNEMHFHAEVAQDVLTRDEQIRLARWMKFEDEGGMLAVEHFMRHYYRLTTDLHDLMLRFIGGINKRSCFRRFVDRLLCQRPAPHLLLTREWIGVKPQTPDSELRDAEVLLELLDLARRHQVPLHQDTLERVRDAAPECVVSLPAKRLFLSHLANPTGLGGYLRQMHRVGLLERLLPGFTHARCLIQFTLCHHYTVDEHSLRAVEAAARRSENPGTLGQAYREIARKDLLHLALLLHDLGKGMGEDHSEVGRRMAEEVAASFELDEHERRLLVFLVHKHLLMAYTAFRRDLTDVPTLIHFARSVATAETLRMLFVLTAADTEAVSPVEWTSWKEMLLTQLYVHTAEDLTGDSPLAEHGLRVENIREQLRQKLVSEFPADYLRNRLAQMPASYVLTATPESVAEDLRVLRTLQVGAVRVASSYSSETGFTQYSVYTWDDLTPGLFSKIAGALAASGFQISTARILTQADGVVLDSFTGRDMAFRGEPSPDRRQEISQRIEDVLLGRQSVEELLAQSGFLNLDDNRALLQQQPQVEVDNHTSDQYTILEVFAQDRLGLLHDITRTLVEFDLSVHTAKIATHHDQIVDVFYVSTRQGGKLNDADRLLALRDRLLDVV